MKVLSLYCGAGGLDEGLKQAGIKTTLAIDVWKDACETMKLNHDCEVINGKVSDYESTFDKFDIVVGGPPCQTFSYNNANRQNDMTEVNAFVRIVEKIKPKFYLMENVMALYKLFEWNGMRYKINCSHYGNPQNRKRVFWTDIPMPRQDIELKNVSDIIDTHGFKYIFKSGNTHQNRKVRTKNVNGQCDTITSSDKMYFTDHVIVSEKYGFNFNVPKQELTTSEIAQLQGFPKDYKFYGGNTSQRKQIGNAVPIQASRKWFNQIRPLQILNNGNQNKSKGMRKDG